MLAAPPESKNVLAEAHLFRGRPERRVALQDGASASA
jgi:hypothetical protein